MSYKIEEAKKAKNYTTILLLLINYQIVWFTQIQNHPTTLFEKVAVLKLDIEKVIDKIVHKEMSEIIKHKGFGDTEWAAQQIFFFWHLISLMQWSSLLFLSFSFAILSSF